MNKKIKISPLFFLLILIFALNDMISAFFVYLFVLILHEFAHSFVARKLGYSLNQFYFLPFGVGVAGDDFFFRKDEILIALAGPLMNFFLLVLTLAVWWVFPQTYLFSLDFAFANYVTCVYNLLPAFPLDGGRVLNAIFKQKYSTKSAHKFTQICSLIVSVLFCIVFVITCFKTMNLTIGLSAIIIFSSSFSNSSRYELNANKKAKFNSSANALSLNSVVVSNETPIYKLNALINPRKLNRFLVINENLQIVKTIYESELNDLFTKYSSVEKLKNIK